MGYWAEAFKALNGYDQGMRGMGYQDVDLRFRFKKTTGFTQENALSRDWKRFSAGFSLCNDPEGDATKAFNLAKIKNCDPSLKIKSWGQINSVNTNIGHSSKSPKRNPELSFSGLGMPWVLWEPQGVRYYGRGQLMDDLKDEFSERPATTNILPYFTWGAWEVGEAQIHVRTQRFTGMLGDVVPASAIGAITCYSTGVQTPEALYGKENVAGMRLTVEACGKGRGRGQGPVVNETLIGETLKHEGIIPRSHKVVPVDCRWISDPHRHRELTHHVGSHRQILQGFSQHRFFRTWLVKTMWTIALAMQEHVDVAVVTYCNSGSHRSVAGCLILEHLLQATVLPGWSVRDTVHTCKRVWAQRRCGMCQTCSEQTDDKDKVFKTCRQVWRELASG